MPSSYHMLSHSLSAPREAQTPCEDEEDPRVYQCPHLPPLVAGCPGSFGGLSPIITIRIGLTADAATTSPVWLGTESPLTRP